MGAPYYCPSQRKYRFINHKQKNCPNQNKYHGLYKQLVGSGQVRMKVMEGTLGMLCCEFSYVVG